MIYETCRNYLQKRLFAWFLYSSFYGKTSKMVKHKHRKNLKTSRAQNAKNARNLRRHAKKTIEHFVCGNRSKVLCENAPKIHAKRCLIHSNDVCWCLFWRVWCPLVRKRTRVWVNTYSYRCQVIYCHCPKTKRMLSLTNYCFCRKMSMGALAVFWGFPP